MGDKSPKAKQRDKNQKHAAKTETKNVQVKRQESYSSSVAKEKKK